ncbi:amidohydrolase family protein [Pseudolysinimonas sp.]|jgi:cytosine/adenosine deaminase-related metal-dependent hydrolase|uniref:amidohydrolase family protein n=1 Tax=Pseudolysinimonas sp. TaxID=2680009 RepID=UPI0037844379
MSPSTLRARKLLAAADTSPLDDVAVVVRDGVVSEVRPWREAEIVGEVVEVDGLLAPGFVDAHSHLRGLPLPEHGLPPRAFEAWICSLAAATELDADDEALVATTELLQTGVVAVQGFVDVGAGDDPLVSARAALSGVARSGIRALVVLGFADRALRTPEPPEGDWSRVPPAAAAMAADRIPRVARDWLATATPARVALGIGPVGGQWSSDELLAAVAVIDGVRRHTHLHESRLHRGWLAGQPSPLDRLDAAGLLDGLLSGAHAVHLTDAELDRLAAAGTALVHCPTSNRALRVGTADVRGWLDRGIPAGLGLDSQNTAAPDLFETLRDARAISADAGRPLDATEVLALATTGGARALGIAGGGRIAPGSPADLVELVLPTSASDAEAIVETGSPRAVRRVWVSGEEVVTDGRSLADPTAARRRLRERLDADRVARDARRERLAPILDLVDGLAEARA